MENPLKIIKEAFFCWAFVNQILHICTPYFFMSQK